MLQLGIRAPTTMITLRCCVSRTLALTPLCKHVDNSRQSMSPLQFVIGVYASTGRKLQPQEARLIRTPRESSTHFLWLWLGLDGPLWAVPLGKW